jgi:hypothetical protein
VYRWLSVLLPHLAGIFVNGMVIDDVGVQPLGHARSDGAACPRCGEESRRVHSRYQRRWRTLRRAGGRWRSANVVDWSTSIEWGFSVTITTSAVVTIT